MIKPLLIILIYLLGSIGLPAQEPQKRALIIAVGEYAPNTGWKSLHSANDVELITAGLQSQGFPKEDVLVLQDAQARKETITRRFKEHLIDRARPGDIAFFHFSGHGQQIVDQNGDEQDGFDEALVPYDSPQQFQSGIYEGERLIRDDELNQWLLQLRQKLGNKGQVLVVLDACHSGTATRGYAPSRGSETIMAAPERKVIGGGNSNTVDHFTETVQETNLAPIIAISASSAQQLNYEYRDASGRYYGSLSYAFSKSLQDVRPFTSYRELFDRIKMEMVAIAPRQNPQIEGETDRMLFGNAIRQDRGYLSVVRTYGPQTVLLDQGSLAGIHPGTKIDLFPSNTVAPKGQDALASGTVTHVMPLLSELTLDRSIDRKEVIGAKAFISDRNYGKISLRVHCKLPEGSLRESFLALIQNYPFLVSQQNNPDVVLSLEADNVLMLRSSDDYPLLEEPLLPGEEEALIRKAIRRMSSYVQATFLRKLEIENPYLKVEMKLVPVVSGAENGQPKVERKIPIEEKLGPNSSLRLAEGDAFILEITNKGAKPAYYNVLDIWADNQIYGLIPNAECPSKAGDYFIRPSETQLLEDCIIQVFPPYGNEMLKLIATEQPIDLQKMIELRGQSQSEADNNPFVQLFQSTFKDYGQRAATSSIPPFSAHIHTIVFQITKR